MPFTPKVYCGFGDIMIHLSAKNTRDIIDYNRKMAEFPKMQVASNETWIRERRRNMTTLKNR